jgi:hypothetical protein
MPFKKMTKPKYPPRLWELRGYPGSGKTTFATQMRTPLLPIDADNRFAEVVHLADGDVYRLSDDPSDNTDARRIADLLDANMPGSDVATIVVDSLTTIIAPLVAKAILANDAGENKNRIAAFKEKALAMRTLQDAVTRWGCDVLFVYHVEDARDGQARAVTRTSISDTELARLMRSVNLKLEIVQSDGRRGVKVVWARRGRSGMVLWDDTGCWRGMPEKIEQAVYDGLTDDERARLERGEVTVFPSPEVALAWAVEQGAFEDEVHARNAYDKIKREENPQTAYQMAALWIGDVQRRTTGDAASKASAEAAEELMPEPETKKMLEAFVEEPDPAPGAQTLWDQEELDAAFPRDEEGEPLDTTPPAVAPDPDFDEIDVNAFWKRYYELVGQGKLAREARSKGELARKIEAQDWAAAWHEMHGRMRV